MPIGGTSDPIVRPLVEAAQAMLEPAGPGHERPFDFTGKREREALARLRAALVPFQEPDTEGGDARGADRVREDREDRAHVAGGESVDSGLALKQVLSAFKVWKQATESRCRLLSSREASDTMLFPDRAFIDAVEEITTTQQKGKG